MKMRVMHRSKSWRDAVHERIKLRTRVFKAKLHRYGEVLCYCCKRPVLFVEATLEHIIPVSDGGHPTDMNNLDISHGPCNSKRGNLRGVYRRLGKTRRLK